MSIYHYILYISIQIYGQPTLLLWHNIHACVPIRIAENGTILYEKYSKNFWGRTPIPPSITILLDTLIYMHMHILKLVKCKKNHGKSCLGPGTLPNQYSEAPLSLSLGFLRSADNVGRPFCCCIVFSFFLRSADNVGRPFCCCVVFSFLFIFLFLLFLSHYLRSAISLPFFIGSLSYLASW